MKKGCRRGKPVMDLSAPASPPVRHQRSAPEQDGCDPGPRLIDYSSRERLQCKQQLPLPHSDPADRFLAATARVLGLTLVTADERLLGLGEIATLANR